MNSIYRCTILIFILLSQLDLFTSVEGAPEKAQGTRGRGDISTYKAIAIAERDKNAGKSTRVSAPKSKARKVQVDPSTGAKTMDIPLDSFGETEDDDIVVVEQKIPDSKVQVVHASEGATARADSARPKYSVSTEVRKVGAQDASEAHAVPAAPTDIAGKTSRSDVLKKLQDMANDLNRQYAELTAEVERRKAGEAPAPKAELIEVLEEHKSKAVKPTSVVPKKPEYITSVEEVRRPPKTSQPSMGQAHLPADIQAVAEAAIPTQGMVAGQSGARAGQYPGDKIDLLHHKVDRVYSDLAILSNNFAKMQAKFDAFISAVSTGSSTATAAQAAASLDSHAKPGTRQQHRTGDDRISSYELASQFPSGWHEHSFDWSGIVVDLTDLRTDNKSYEVKEHGDVVTLVFNKSNKVDDLRCAGTKVWELGYKKKKLNIPKISAL